MATSKAETKSVNMLGVAGFTDNHQFLEVTALVVNKMLIYRSVYGTKRFWNVAHGPTGAVAVTLIETYEAADALAQALSAHYPDTGTLGETPQMSNISRINVIECITRWRMYFGQRFPVLPYTTSSGSKPKRESGEQFIERTNIEASERVLKMLFAVRLDGRAQMFDRQAVLRVAEAMHYNSVTEFVKDTIDDAVNGAARYFEAIEKSLMSGFFGQMSGVIDAATKLMSQESE